MAGEPDEAGGRREDVLAVLRGSTSALTIAAIADRLGVHPNTVRFHLDILVADGRAERAEAAHRRAGRPPQLFRAAPRMDPGGQRQYRLLAEILTLGLADESDAPRRALNAGRAWARRVMPMTPEPLDARESVDQLVGLLAELGFAPHHGMRDGEVRVALRHCPFLELAEGRTSVVCPIHLGLMQGAMEAWRAPVTVDRLEPFVEPNLCLAHLRTREES